MKHIFTLIIALTALASNAQTANFWTKKSDYGGWKIARAVAFTINDMGYVGTGVDTAETVHKDFWQYNPVSDTWAQVANLPGAPRRNASAFSIGNKGYVGGGVDHDVSWMGTILNDFYEYDAASNTWTAKATIPGMAKYFATGFSVGSKGYICCGKMGPNNYSTALVEYDPATNSWTNKASFPGGVRYQLSSFSINDKGYVGLGVDQDMFRNDWYEYNPATDQWTQKSNLPASERGGAHTFTLGQRGFVCMGNNGGYLDDLWEYNPFTDSWSVKANYGGSKRKNGVGFAVLGRGYVGTGQGYSGKKESFQMYTPSEVIGINEINADAITVYPNPTVDYVNIKSVSNDAIDQIEIYTVAGELLYQQDFAPTIEVAHLSSGMYMLVAKDETGQIVANKKIHKQ